MTARSIRVCGVVQGVGFRPFVFRLARAHSLAGWVLNEESGVDIRLEGAERSIETFLRDLTAQPPPAARITSVDVRHCQPAGLREFSIRETRRAGRPLVRISPDLPVCSACLAEMRDPANPRYRYPYINCTNCGPRYSVIEDLPYDRRRTTMRHWPMDALCQSQYHDPSDRRFHAQPVACPACGPRYLLDGHAGVNSVAHAAGMLCDGRILAIKGIGGYHLVCDARDAAAVAALRERKFRKEKPFAVMAASLEVAASLVSLSPEAEALLTSQARPIVLAPARASLAQVAPGLSELGVMLPYAPLHYLLFDSGAPTALVVTSANRSSEPIAYRDDDARERLSGIAEAFLTGERPIARRVDDSVARAGALGPVILRRSRGYAPGAVAVLPVRYPILATGADLKNSITLVAGGQAFVSQHIGDIEHYQSLQAFKETVRDVTTMYQIDAARLVVAHDAHPQYASTLYALELDAARHVAVQHHRAHVASVVAEKQAWETRVIGISFDGTGYGDDGTIWGGEFFYGSVLEGLERVLHLRPAALPGGDAAARHPVQCAAGFLQAVPQVPDLLAPPFSFPARYQRSRELLRKGVRVFRTTSAGRLFDTAAALLGFTREITYEGQAAIWLEQLAQGSQPADVYPFPCDGATLDYVPLLAAVMDARLQGHNPSEIARAFHRTIARGLYDAARLLCERYACNTVAISGGVFQNNLLLSDLKALFANGPYKLWSNSTVPPNDGGISLGQAALAAFTPEDRIDA
ncbi:MAG TPA: carbamoyltransferase HypF [Bryobacteraceae bacterium]|nr:carbamoyltransferase HypF [Bryobacteraceae bacterium]